MILGIDISHWTNPLTDDQLDCLWAEGVRFVVVGMEWEDMFVPQLEAVARRGFIPEAYKYLYARQPAFRHPKTGQVHPIAGASAPEQIEWAVERIETLGLPVSALALDVEDRFESGTVLDNINRLRACVRTMDRVAPFMPWDLYSRHSYWVEHLANTHEFAPGRGLWNAFFDNDTDIDFHAWPYGGFDAGHPRFTEQYHGTNLLCGVNNDRNVRPNVTLLEAPMYLHPVGSHISVSQVAGQRSVTGIIHRGTDFEAPYGHSIKAAQAGVVRRAVDGIRDNWGDWRNGDPAWGGYGNHVIVDHFDGSWSLYAHIAPGRVAVQTGQHVVTGQFLGSVGSSGISSGAHLHFELWRPPAFALEDHRPLLTDDIALVDGGDDLSNPQSLIQALKACTPDQLNEVVFLLQEAKVPIAFVEPKNHPPRRQLDNDQYWEPMRRNEAIAKAVTAAITTHEKDHQAGTDPEEVEAIVASVLNRLEVEIKLREEAGQTG